MSIEKSTTRTETAPAHNASLSGPQPNGGSAASTPAEPVAESGTISGERGKQIVGLHLLRAWDALLFCAKFGDEDVRRVARETLLNSGWTQAKMSERLRELYEKAISTTDSH